MERIDFKITPMSVDTVEQLGQFTDQLNDAMVNAGIPAKMREGPSVEEQVTIARRKVEVADAKVARREAIEDIQTALRTQEQKDALKSMLSAKVLTEAATSAGQALSELEKKETENNRKCKEVNVFVNERVSDPLWRLYKEARDANEEDKLKGVHDGIKALKERLRIAPNSVMSNFKSKVAVLGTTFAVTRPGALSKLDSIDRLKRESEDMAKLLGAEPGSAVSDAEAIAALRGGVKHKVGEGCVQSSVQEELDSVDRGIITTWKELSDKVRKLLESSVVRDRLDSDKKEEDGDQANYAFSAAPAQQLQQQQQGQGQVSFLGAFKASNQPQNGQGGFMASNANSQAQQTQQQNQSMPFQVFYANGAAGPAAYIPAWGVGGSQIQQVYGQQGLAFNAVGQWSQGGAGGGGGGGNGKSQGVCYAYQNGQCFRGNGCKFQHVMVNAGAAGGGQASPPKKKTVCLNDGGCWNANCKFDHPNGTAYTKANKGGKEKKGSPYNNDGNKRTRFT